MKNLFDIQGQVVVITGGTGVLGREIGEYLALQGAKVVLMGRNEEPGKQIVGGIRGKGGEVEEFERVLNVNLTGTVIPTQIFLRPMVEAGKGAIVNFSSMAAFRPMTRVCGYAAAKAGISNFTAFLANEVATKFTSDIRVNAIAPGFFLTNQNRALLTNPDGSLTPRGEDVIRQTPFKRFGRPEELCGTIHYLISEASAFVTGTVAVVDGGFNAFAM